jgi:hypothetical protein
MADTSVQNMLSPQLHHHQSYRWFHWALVIQAAHPHRLHKRDKIGQQIAEGLLDKLNSSQRLEKISKQTQLEHCYDQTSAMTQR